MSVWPDFAVLHSRKHPVILLENSTLRLDLDPELGAAIWSISAQVRGNWQTFCAGPGEGRSIGDAMASALFIMVPFANRVRNNTILDGERKWHMKPNTNEPLVLHGTGWERPWKITSRSSNACALHLDVMDDYPLRFGADYSIELVGMSVRFDLVLTNKHSKDMPAGMGFHPYFFRNPNTELQFEANGYWEEGEDYLPKSYYSLARAESYKVPRNLPNAWHNICYSGWNRRARISQPDLGYQVELTGTQDLNHLMVFSSPDSDRFAVEPQSHLSGETKVTQSGLRRLRPGQSWQQSMTLTVSEI